MFGKVLSWVIGAWGIFMIFFGVSMMLWPQIIIDNYALQPVNAMGWSALSGNFATLIIMLGISAAWGALKQDIVWLFNTVLMEAIIMVGRIVAIIQYGYIDDLAGLIGAEILIAVLLIVRIMQLKKQA